MNDLPNIILSKLIFYEYLDPFNKVDIEDLKDNIYNMWQDYNYVKDIIEAGYNLDYIINDINLLQDILDLINDNNGLDQMNSIYDNLDNLDLLDNNYEDLLKEKIDEFNKEINM